MARCRNTLHALFFISDRIEEEGSESNVPQSSETTNGVFYSATTSLAASETTPTMSMTSSSSKGKLNRKKRRRRDYLSKHSRNSSKTSLKEILHGDGHEEDLSGKDLLQLKSI